MKETDNVSVPARHRSLWDYFVLFIKGLFVGAANVIPGVSGGTIAFLTGIYQELLDSLKSIDRTAVKYFFTLKWGKFNKRVNMSFLAAVILGVVASIFSLARVMTYLLENEPIAIWSFFFGLIIVSSVYVLREIKKWDLKAIVSLIVGAAIGVAICLLTPSTSPDGLWFVFITGALAISAMILPGISGSFIMLLLGKYDQIMTAVGNIPAGIATWKDIVFLLVFALGAIVGLLAFSRLLSWLLKRWYDATICLLSGFMIGSLLKVWPWNITLPSGISKVLSPAAYSAQVGLPHVWTAVIWFVVGAAIVIIMEVIAEQGKKKKAALSK